VKQPAIDNEHFDLLRLLFAGTVCSYAYELSGYQQLMDMIFVVLLAIKAFFCGGFDFMSFERSSSVSSYAIKRVRRIYPAYFTVVMLCAIGLICVSSRNPGGYFSLTWIKYVLANLSFLNFLQLTLPGVFDNNKLAVVNGALWTLKIEVMFYLAFPYSSFVPTIRRLSILVIITACL
jgi:peptidoglycan/LPS O-acetylase OafA/YrhL